MIRTPLRTTSPGPRSCDGCQECCRVIGVTELAKPAGEHCRHQCEAGCGVYETRPASCRTYGCLWQLGFLPDDAHRPDRLGLLFDLRDDPGIGPRVVAWETQPGAVPASAGLLTELATQCHMLVQPMGSH